MRSSTWFVTILLVAAMFTALACSASDLGNQPSPVGDSTNPAVELTPTNESAPPVEPVVDAKPAEAKLNEVGKPWKPAAEVEGIAA